MRHVTDGELHAYLDGALDLLPEGRGGEVREHLGSCPVCRERLQDEEKVRGQAQSLLGSSAPPEAALPPFEELRIRAEAAERREGERAAASQDGSQRYRGPLKGPSLAWAATIVLALGVGWMGGEVWRTGPEETVRDFYFPETLAEPASETEPQEMAPAPAVVGPEMAPASAVAEVEMAPASPVVGADRARMEGMLQAESEAAPMGVAGDSEPESARARLSPKELNSSIRLGSAGDSAQANSLGFAGDTALENSLAVPGLEVLSVEWEEWVPGERGLQIRQLLPMGDTLELRYLGMLMGADLERPEESRERGVLSDAVSRLPQGMEASLPPGWNQVVMKTERGWLVARAPISEAYLRALLRSLH